MKKKIANVKNKQSGIFFMLVSMVIILIVGIIVWYNAPIKLMDLDYNEVMEIFTMLIFFGRKNIYLPYWILNYPVEEIKNLILLGH